MPARKPSSLNRRHETAAERQARADAESALTPESELPLNSPDQLSGHRFAQSVWRRMMRTFDELEGIITTKLDLDLLVDYCLMMEQAAELDQMRKEAILALEILKLLRDQYMKEKDYVSAEKAAAKLAPAMELVVKIDSRADRKRAELNKMRTYLYLTPRARAGANPEKKNNQEEELDPMAALLDEVTNYVNGENGDQDK